MRRAGRLHVHEIEVLLARRRGEPIELRAPGPGVFVPWIAEGDLVTPGAAIGELVVLGRASTLVVSRAASDATGLALRLVAATHPVAYGDVLVALHASLQPAATASAASAAAAGSPAAAQAAASAGSDGLVFRAPTSGRFYSRPAADKPPFVTEGGPVTAGTTICLLEVMKTFHRVHYGGAGLPDTARVRRVLVADGADVNAGDPLLALE